MKGTEDWIYQDDKLLIKVIRSHQALSVQVHPDDAYAAAHENGSLENYLVKYPVARGDVIDIPAGTIHAIGGGCTILEVQQNSGLTYRLYDYKRLDAEGKPRELHLSKALDVAKLTPAENLTGLPFQNEFFAVEMDGNTIRVYAK